MKTIRLLAFEAACLVLAGTDLAIGIVRKVNATFDWSHGASAKR